MMPIHEVISRLEDEFDADEDAQGITFRRAHARPDNDPPEDLLRDLRLLTTDEARTLWQSPTYRALLMASQGASIVTFFHSQEAYSAALEAARRGELPAAWSREPADEIGGPELPHQRGWAR